MDSAHKQCQDMIDKTMMVVINNTQYGINGLIGNKLLETYQRPLLILKDFGDTYSGSMRAIGVDDFRQICNNSGMAQADGHELASGITIKKKDLEKFCDYIENNVKLEPKQTIDVDVELNVEDITRKLIEQVKKIDRISGTNHKPIKILVKNIDMYGIGQMSDYKHLVIKPNDYLLIIKWNFDGSFEEMEDHSMMNDEIQVVGTLDSGFLGRKFMLKLVCDDVKVVD
jgi:single-stranded-DNA-specific exonuclease